MNLISGKIEFTKHFFLKNIFKKKFFESRYSISIKYFFTFGIYINFFILRVVITSNIENSIKIKIKNF